MAKFVPNKPIETRKPSIEVDAGLPPGEYRFQLIVEDDQGRRSVADEQIVRIVDRGLRLTGEETPEPAPTPAPRKRQPAPKPEPPLTKRSRKPK